MPHHRVETALEAWRDAERRLEEAEPGTPEEAQAHVEVEHWRAEYEEAVAAAGDLNPDASPAS